LLIQVGEDEIPFDDALAIEHLAAFPKVHS